MDVINGNEPITQSSSKEGSENILSSTDVLVICLNKISDSSPKRKEVKWDIYQYHRWYKVVQHANSSAQYAQILVHNMIKVFFEHKREKKRKQSVYTFFWRKVTLYRIIINNHNHEKFRWWTTKSSHSSLSTCLQLQWIWTEKCSKCNLFLTPFRSLDISLQPTWRRNNPR